MCNDSILEIEINLFKLMLILRDRRSSDEVLPVEKSLKDNVYFNLKQYFLHMIVVSGSIVVSILKW